MMQKRCPLFERRFCDGCTEPMARCCSSYFRDDLMPFNLTVVELVRSVAQAIASGLGKDVDFF